MNKKWLNNKTIVITGASSGIGKELTKLFITKNNCKVIGVARSEEKMKNLIRELGENAKNFEYRLFDVSVEQNWIDFGDSLKEPIDLLVNNAGIFHKFDNFINVSIEQGKQLMNINFFSVVYGCKTFLPKISECGGIVNICSSDALLSVAGTNYYAASKGAIKCFSQSLISEYPNNYIGCMFPGFTKTELFRQIDFNSKEAKLIDRFTSTCEKIARKIHKAILKRKRYKIMGYDAKIFQFLGKHYPVSGVKLVNGILQKTKLDIFSTIVDKN